MDKSTRLALYELALVDWQKPITPGDSTSMGFCHYFEKVHSVKVFDKESSLMEEVLPELFEQRLCDGDLVSHYDDEGWTEIGRSQRVIALQNAINYIQQ